MASFKEKLDKNGNRIYEVQASNGRGRRVWRTFRPEPTWSKRTIQRELQKFAAELEQQLADGEVLTREETAQKAAAEAVEAAKIKTFRQCRSCLSARESRHAGGKDPGQLYPAVGAACLSGSGPCAAAGNHPGHDKGVTFQSVRGACLRQRDKGVCCTT